MDVQQPQFQQAGLGMGPVSPPLEGGQEGPVVCNACKEGLDETLDNTVVSFGKYLFHVDCFRCAKCHNLVEHNTNLLLLSDGSPVCENCSYICSVCQKPIHNEAIVTGDESYHADCFRCRSCSNKIEELIFAKTNQGIWCMSCHNERVARTRKHAEAKRNRQARKEKEGGTSGSGTAAAGSSSSRSGGARRTSEREHRERDKDREKDRTMEMPDVPQGPTPSGSSLDLSSATASSGAPAIRPLPPSPVPPSSAGYPRSSFDASSSSDTHRRAQTTPGEAPRHTPPYPLAPSHSSQSISTTLSASSPSGRPTTPLHAPALNAHSRTSSQMSAQEGGVNGAGAGEGRRTSASQLRQEINNAAAVRRPSGESTREQQQRNDFQPYPLPDSPHVRPQDDTASFSDAGGSYRNGGALSPTMSDAQLSASASNSRNGSLSAPSAGGTVDKSANRRSGFYGLGQRPSVSSESGGGGAVESLRSGAGSPSSGSFAAYGRSTTPPPPAAGASSQHYHHYQQQQQQQPPTSSSELHNSMSFYDPDTLLFLNHVGSAPSSPKLGAAAGAGVGTNKALPDLALSLSRDDDQTMERLSPSPGPVDVSGESDEDGLGLAAPRDPASGGGGGGGLESSPRRRPDVARKVRESIHLAKRESGNAAGGEGGGGATPGGLDVELVEMLLKELEETKKDMKEIKSKYNAFRRASRSAFEGFSMAREEYDKEVAARRDAERQMDALRAKFLEQAKRLAQVDQEQRSAEQLKRQSKDLRNSLVGMEKHLSMLKTEVALSTAQIAELSALGKEDIKVADRTSTTSAVQDEVAEALDARLEAIKDAHRDEVNALIAQRDDLKREVDELRQIRDAHLEEAEALSTQNASLVEKNADASRQLDQLQESLARMQLMSSKSAALPVNGRGGHSHTPSSASLSSSSATAVGPGARSPLATARVIGSPAEMSESFRFAKPEAVEVHSRNKFKWGKGKSTSSSASAAAAADQAKANQQLPPVPAGARSPVPPRAGSIDNTVGVRQHAFQQTSILRPVRCDYCGDKMWGLNEVRCTACGSYAHAKCAGYLSNGCHPGGSASHGQDDTLNFTPTGPPIFGGDLVGQATAEGRDVPVVVSKCIDAVEAYGMAYEGIYRKTGGMGQTKLITQYFERGLDFDLQDRDKFNDIAAITSCMKNYFRSLPVPLFTHDLHEEFVAAAEQSDADGRVKAIELTLYKLPPVHFHTARLLFQHLHRIKSLSAENKMTSANLGVVFGPTVLRSPVAAREWSDMGPKAKIVEILCDHADSLFAKPYPSN
ncbi:hypothetical protein JCM6882_001956 [Rhodosporidiobolus microsporus]